MWGHMMHACLYWSVYLHRYRHVITCAKHAMLISWRFYDVCTSVQSAHIHWIAASSIIWLWKPLSILQLNYQSCWVDTRIGSLGSAEDLPACHPKWPLHKKVSYNQEQMKSVYHFENVWLLQSSDWIIPNCHLLCIWMLYGYGLCTCTYPLCENRYIHACMVMIKMLQVSICPHNLDGQHFPDGQHLHRVVWKKCSLWFACRETTNV